VDLVGLRIDCKMLGINFRHDKEETKPSLFGMLNLAGEILDLTVRPTAGIATLTDEKRKRNMGKLWNSVTKAMAKQRRKMLANEIFERHAGIVQRGAYKGLRLGGDSNVSRGPLGLKILGLYEPPVVAEIVGSAPFDDLINFGAADGYMSIGPLFSGLCKRSICFELTEAGRTSVKANAAQNGVSKDVVIRGAADETLMAQLGEIGIDPQNSVILCDIEGAEFTVFSTEVLAALKGAKIIIELHDTIMPEGAALREALIGRLPTGARTRILRADGVDFAGIKDLDEMHDIDRALVMSEARKWFGEWLVIDYEKEA